jgi:hypothetical protein
MSSVIQQQLTEIVRNTEQVRTAEGMGRLIRIPTGDWMALVFFNSGSTCSLRDRNRQKVKRTSEAQTADGYP